jgi:hypothetical protein
MRVGHSLLQGGEIGVSHGWSPLLRLVHYFDGASNRKEANRNFETCCISRRHSPRRSSSTAVPVFRQRFRRLAAPAIRPRLRRGRA